MNHDRDRIVPGATIELMQLRSGLSLIARLPDCAETRRIILARSRWRDLSISIKNSEHTRVTDWDRCVSVITQVRSVKEASLMIDDDPAFPDTWATDDFDEGLRRLQVAEDAACRAIWGADYKRTCPRRLVATSPRAGRVA